MVVDSVFADMVISVILVVESIDVVYATLIPAFERRRGSRRRRQTVSHFPSTDDRVEVSKMAI